MMSPLPPERWNFATAAHLLGRAGFGATPAEIERAAGQSPKEVVQALVNWEAVTDSTTNPEWAKPDPERGAKLKAYRESTGEERARLQKERNREQRTHLVELQSWWLQRMATGPRPLQEKLTLFWHGHFATSAQKVRDAYLMWRQNDLFRRQGAGSWKTLLREVSRDPAMLIWLDQAQSRPPNPNENYARELMELFALAEGNYTEQDVTEAARALTGLTLDRLTQEPAYRPRLHDPGTKTVLGKTGKLGLDELLEVIVSQPAADCFITGKLWMFFAGTQPSPELQEALAARFREGGRSFAPFLQAMFLSEEFYAPNVIRQQIKSPVQLVVMACRQLERPLPPAAQCTNALRLLGQELFNPPNVKGWEGGIAWINTNTLLNRHNLALLLVTGENPMAMATRKPTSAAGKGLQRVLNRPAGAANPDRLLSEADRTSPEKLLQAVERRFLNGPLKAKERQPLLDYLAAQGALDDQDLLGLIRLTLCTPEYQLC